MANTSNSYPPFEGWPNPQPAAYQGLTDFDRDMARQAERIRQELKRTFQNIYEGPTITGTVTAAGLIVSGTATIGGALTLSDWIIGPYTGSLTAGTRFGLKTSVTNGVTSVVISPNGTGAYGGILCLGSSDRANTAYFELAVDRANSRGTVNLSGVGTFTQYPMTFLIGGVIVAQFNAAGRMLIGSSTTDDTVSALQVRGSTGKQASVTLEATGASTFARVIMKTPTREWRVLNDTTGNLALFDNTAGVYRAQLDTGGLFRLGAGAPSTLYNLEIDGSISSRNSAAAGIFYHDRGNDALSWAQYATASIGRWWNSAVGDFLQVTYATGRISLVYGQLTFPATQNASTDANTLDDYEEGSWTPSFSGGTGAGTFTYTFRQGTYVKIGGWVFVKGRVGISAASVAPTGNLWVIGLPFTNNSGHDCAAAIGYAANFDVAPMGGSCPNGTTRINLFKITSTLNWGRVSSVASDVASGSADLIFELCYYTG